MNAAQSRARRIVVAFDPQRPDAAPLEFGVPLAHALAQRLYALYVEDLDTLSLGAFGCVTTICAATGEARLMSRESVERDFRRLAAEARAAFATAAARTGRAEFAAVRGRLAEELRRASGDAAAVLVGRPRTGLASRSLAAGLLDTLLALPVAVTGMVASHRGSASRVLAVLRSERLAVAGGVERLLDAPLPQAVLRSLGAARPMVRTGGVGLRSDALLRELRRGDVGTIVLERGASADDRALIRELLAAWPGSVLSLQGEEC